MLGFLQLIQIVVFNPSPQQNKVCEQKEFFLELIMSTHNRHTTQIRQLLQKERLSKSRFNPQSRIVVYSPSMKQSRQLKKSSSSSSFHLDKQKQLQLQIMQKRYQQLYFEYEKMVEESRKKAQMCKRQQEEIGKYERSGDRDRKQIERLKSMIGMINKKQNCVQTIEDKNAFAKQYNFVEPFVNDKKGLKIKESTSYQDLFHINSNKNYRMTSQNDENYKFNTLSNPMISSTLLNQSRQLIKRNSSGIKNDVTNKPLSKQMSEKEMMKRFQHSKINDMGKVNNEYSKMAESLLYGNKSSIDFRRKKTHLQKGSSIIDNAQQNNKESQVFAPNPSSNIKNSRVKSGNLKGNLLNARVNSPNSRFKFVPSVDI